MFSYIFSPASSYWCFPLFVAPKDQDHALAEAGRPGRIDWLPHPCSPGHYGEIPREQGQSEARLRGIREVLSTNDLYHILGVPRAPAIDRLTLRRAYLSRSKACHPDKCPGNPEATDAFQRVSIAYGVLSQPSLKRMYDAHPASDTPSADFLRSHPCGYYPNETLKSVLLGIISDYLDGNLEMIRTLLQAIRDLNPSVKLTDDNINAVLRVLKNIRGRVLSCRACILALHAQLVRVLELQYAFRQLPYLDVAGRSRLTIQLTRITLSLPVTLEKAIQDAQEDIRADGQSGTMDGTDSGGDKAALLPKHVVLLIRNIDVILDRMERILG